MKPSRVLLAGVAIAAVAASSSMGHETLQRLPPAAHAGETTMYGHIKSLTRKGGRFELRFDPAW